MTTDSSTHSARCKNCSAPVEPTAKFCSQCGAAVGAEKAKLQLGPKQIAQLLILTAALWCFGWFSQQSLAGARPTQTFRAPEQDPEVLNPEITKLRKATETNPDDPKAWLTLASALYQSLEQQENPSQTVAMEIVSALSEVLSRDKENLSAILMMAEVSFRTQIFDKAAQFYERFLTQRPDDIDAAVKRGAALSFMGKMDQGAQVLEGVAKAHPDNFMAHAYLAITYAQKGDDKKAEEIGKKALTLAPEEEARVRFERFLENLKNKGRDVPQPPPGGGSEAEKLAAYVQSNPIAGPKFAGLTLIDAATLKLEFNSFPMSQMPPFAKDKFLGGIKDFVKQQKITRIKTVIFIDHANGSEMERLALSDP